MEYRSRTFRIDDEVWEAIQKHELSANKLLRVVLGLEDARGIMNIRPGVSAIVPADNFDGAARLDAVSPELSSSHGKASTEVVRRGPRQKGDKTR